MKVHSLKGYIQNIYLIEEHDQLLLLDGCCRADVKTIQNFITQDLSRPFHDLKAIVVTHMHPDHAGAAAKLRKLTGCKVYSSEFDQHWYKGLEGLIMFITDIILTWYVARKMGKPIKNIFYSPKLKPCQKLKDNESLAEFPNWKVISTPGHTDRDLSVWHAPSGSVYVADLVVKLKRRLISPFPIFHPNKYKSSLEKIDSLPVQTLYMAHGQPIDKSEFKLIDEIHSIPQKPKTHWRATRAKFKRLIKRLQ